MVSMPDVEEKNHMDVHVLEEDSDDEVDPFDDPLGLGDDEASLRSGSAQLSAAEVTLFLLDWMCTHKVLLKCVRHIVSCRHMYITINMM